MAGVCAHGTLAAGITVTQRVGIVPPPVSYRDDATLVSRTAVNTPLSGASSSTIVSPLGRWTWASGICEYRVVDPFSVSLSDSTGLSVAVPWLFVAARGRVRIRQTTDGSDSTLPTGSNQHEPLRDSG
jgi:hypothetical protein